MTLKPDPPPQVEVLRIGSGEATALRLFQLFATQALPAGSITASVRICILPLRNTWMTSPGLPAGWPFKTPYTAHRGHGINASILTPHQEKDGASLLAQQAQFQKPLNSHCCLAVFLGLPRYCWFQA